MKKAPVHAISIRQPYVEQILQGKKRFEYRTKPTRILARVYLYASMKPKTGLPPSEWKKIGKTPDDLPYGQIVGTVAIVKCKQLKDGSYAYVLDKPKRMRPPRKPKKSPKPQPCFWRPKF